MLTLNDHINSLFTNQLMTFKYQDQFDNEGNKLSSAELLLKVNSSLYSYRPDVFFNSIGAQGRIIATERILHALHKIFDQKVLISTHKKLSINMDILTLCSSSVVSLLISLSKKKVSELCVEITEDIPYDSSQFQIIYKTMKNLQSHNIKFSMDDFGTGFSNFERFSKLPFNQIKFDKKFLHNSSCRLLTKLYLESCLQMIKDNIEVVFEGIESESDFKWLKSLKNLPSKTFFQGYYFAKPLDYSIT